MLQLIDGAERGGTHHLDAVCPRFTGARESLNGFGAAWTACGCGMRLALLSRSLKDGRQHLTLKFTPLHTPGHHQPDMNLAAQSLYTVFSTHSHTTGGTTGATTWKDSFVSETDSKSRGRSRQIEISKIQGFAGEKKENRDQLHLSLYLLGLHVVQRSAPVLGDSHV